MSSKDIFIIHTTVGFGGGVGTVIKNLINYQIDMGYKVGVLFLKDDRNERFLEIINNKVILFPVNTINFKGVNILRGLPMGQILKKLEKNYPEYKIIFHAHNPVSIGLANEISNLPMLCTIHGINSNTSLASTYITKHIIRKLGKEKKCIIAVSDHTKEYYMNEVKYTNILTIRNGVNVKSLTTFKENMVFNIGYVSNINEHKGWRYLLEAFKILLKEYDGKIKLTIVGDGTIQEVKHLINEIDMGHIKKNVDFLGYIENAGDQIIPNLDLLVLPSISEGLPMSILEAFGHRIPVIATRVGGIPEVIKDGENGFFIPRDGKKIAEKIKIIINDPKLYSLLAENSYNTYSSQFTEEVMGKNYSDVYREILCTENKY